jgi:hypothetical protein
MRMRTRSKSKSEQHSSGEAQTKQRAEVELAPADQVSVEQTSERLLLELIGDKLRGLIDGAHDTILEALSDFQQAVADINLEPPRGLATTIATKVAHEVLEHVAEKVITKISELLGPLTYLVKAAEIVSESVAEESRAGEAEKRLAVVDRIVDSVRKGAQQIRNRGKADVAARLLDRKMDVIALNDSPLLTQPLLDKGQVRDNIVVAYEKALRAAGVQTLGDQIEGRDYARFDAQFEKQARGSGKKEEP